MFWNKKDEPSPLGVPLGDLMVMLQPTSIKASLKGNTLTARHEHYTIRIEVVPPETRESENGPIRAVVRMITELPKPILTLFQGKEAEATAAYNAFAALGVPVRRSRQRLHRIQADDLRSRGLLADAAPAASDVHHDLWHRGDSRRAAPDHDQRRAARRHIEVD
jgi:hypothetical protein